MDELADALTGRAALDDILAGFTVALPPGRSADEAATIRDCFSAASLEDILSRLDAKARAGDAFAEKLLKTIATKSPTSLAIAFEQKRRGRDLDFADAMRTEFRIVSRIPHGHDFYEGVRAVVVDKDQAPKWRPSSLAEVTPAMIEAYFADLGADELPL